MDQLKHSFTEDTLYIVWSDVYCTGIPIIDEQHRTIVSVINSLYYFIENDHGMEIIVPAFNMMVEYSHIHFKTEEALLRAAGYPALSAHIELHRHFLENLKDSAHQAIVEHDGMQLLKILKDWWLHHINQEDRRYVPFMTGKH